MMKLVDRGTVRDFADGAAIIAHFSLSHLQPGEISGIQAASDAGHPLHADVDPCDEEIRGIRVLMLETSAKELASERRQRLQDI